jgi:hypothetical protein
MLAVWSAAVSAALDGFWVWSAVIFTALAVLFLLS